MRIRSNTSYFLTLLFLINLTLFLAPLLNQVVQSMFDMSENTCYLNVIRPPTKSVQHCATGNCQIERASFQNSHFNLQYSIKHSKMLRQYRQKYPYSKPFSHTQCQQLFTIKNIVDQKSKFYVAKTLRQLHSAVFAFHVIDQLRKQKYNGKKIDHEDKLLQIWQNLKPHEKLEARVSDQWISIGFQVNDPATDFRGAGYLGLLNLYHFSFTENCKKIFSIAVNPKTEYFFCSAGLFITMLVPDLMKQRKINYDYWVHSEHEQLMKKFQILFQLLFMEFSNYWMQNCEDKSILYFNQNLKNFEKMVKSWSPIIFRAKLLDFLSQNL